MKKLFLLLIAVVLLFSLTACSGGAQYVTTQWGTYEQLTYTVTEQGSDSKGQLVLTVEMLSTATDISIPQIDENGKIEIVTENFPKDSHIIYGNMTFGEDTVVYKTITTSTFAPIYSFKCLLSSGDKTLDEDETPVSYVMTSQYALGKNEVDSKSLRRVNSGANAWVTPSIDSEWYLTQSNWSALNTTDWSLKKDTYDDISSPMWDINQLYYAVRSISNVTQDEFSYLCNVPMILESTVKSVSCRGQVISKAKDTCTYIDNTYTTEDNFSLDLSKVTITPTGNTVNGSGINIYYSVNPVHAPGQNKDEVGKLRNLPVLIEENVLGRASATGRGAITYELVSVSITK